MITLILSAIATPQPAVMFKADCEIAFEDTSERYPVQYGWAAATREPFVVMPAGSFAEEGRFPLKRGYQVPPKENGDPSIMSSMHEVGGPIGASFIDGFEVFKLFKTTRTISIHYFLRVKSPDGTRSGKMVCEFPVPETSDNS